MSCGLTYVVFWPVSTRAIEAGCSMRAVLSHSLGLGGSVSALSVGVAESSESRDPAGGVVGVGISSGVGPGAGVGVGSGRRLAGLTGVEVPVMFTWEGAAAASVWIEVACAMQSDSRTTRGVARTGRKWP